MIIELDYDIHDNEMLAIFDIYRESRRSLKSIEYPILVFSDNKNLITLLQLSYLTITIQNKLKN
jgi:hypothetical protein